MAHALLPAANVRFFRWPSSRVARHAVRGTAELYVVVVSALAVAELTSPAPTALAARIGVLLLPVSIGFAFLAARASVLTVRTVSDRRRGADVGRALASLRDRYRVLSRLPLSQRRDDRVVVGTNGIFVIVNDGRRRSHDPSVWRAAIDDCQVEALRVRARARRALRRPLPVHAVLCVPDGSADELRQLHGVRVVDTARVATLITNTFTTAPLAPSDVDAVVAALTAASNESVASRDERRVARVSEARAQRRLMLV
jgi:hypothetical protein